MAQIFLGKNLRSLAVDIMAKYTRAVDADLVKITQVTEDQQKVLNIATTPCMIVTEGERTFKCSSTYAIFRHIAELTRFEKIFLGKNDLDNHQILSYFELINSLTTEELADLLDNDLKLRMFLVTYNITAADIYAYAHIVHRLQGLQDFEKVEKSNLFRWIDHIQHLPGINKYAKDNGLEVTFPDENSKQPSKRELKKQAKAQYNKDKKAESKAEGKPAQKDAPKAEDAQKAPSTEAPKVVSTEEEKKVDDNKSDTADASKNSQKKEKQPKKGGNKKAPEPLGEPITMIGFVVGKITKVWCHPDSEKLYCEEVDIGEEAPRSIASGLQQFIKIEDMQDKMVIVCANLKAKKLGGFASHGMVMCAETPDKSAVELLVPPTGSSIGDKVTIKGFEMNPPPTLNPKKKIFESVVEDFVIDANGLAKFKDAEWVTDKGNVTSLTIKNGIIR
jgi:aminoacyl tRNA synthase complex-interacting multifunctional protein 1